MLISLHIPKTAGTTFKSVLRKIYGDDHIHMDYFHDEYVLTDPYKPTMYMRVKRFKRSLEYSSTVPPSATCICGHFRPSKYLKLFPDAPLVTWVRNPVDRVISHYYYWRAVPDKRHSVGRMVTKGMGLEEFASLDAMRNLQTTYMEGLPLDRFGFVGVTEYFEEMLGHFFHFADLPEVRVESTNINAKKPKTIDPRLVKRIAQLNELDMELYERSIRRAEKERMISLSQSSLALCL